MSSASSLALPAAGPLPSRSWIQSPAFDLTFFILAPVVTLPIVAASVAGWRIGPLTGMVLVFAHYASTLTFYFWDENRAYHRARWLAFFGGPVIIIVGYVLIVSFRVPIFAQFVLFFWNAYHVAMQSCGITSIYRHRAGVSDPEQKRVTNAAILASNGWFALWNIETHEEIFPAFQAVAAWFTDFLRIGLGVLALAALGRLGAALYRRARAEAPPSLPEVAIILASLALFHPYLWVSTSEAATFVMLLPHYVQYLGIVWLLHRRKFRQPSGSQGQLWLHRLSSNVPLLAAALLTVGLGFVFAKFLFTRLGQPQLFEVTYLTFAFLHFYLDGLFWAFKDPHVRRTLGPYLTGLTRAPAAAGGSR